MERRLLPLPEGYALLAKYGIPVSPHRTALSPEEAAHSAGELGFPAVMKVISPDVIHKSDAGGVVIGIGSANEAANAFEEISRKVGERVPGARIEGVVVERQMPPGLELIIGGRIDPSFGRVITIGMGGVLVELVRDVVIGILPSDEGRISGLIRQLKGYRLIAGYRGAPPLDEQALVQAISSLIRMFQEEPGVTEFDVNPVILYQKGVAAVDARIYTGNPGGEPSPDERVSLAPGLFNPQSIAVVGASPDPTKIGYAVFRNLLPFQGTLVPVNPRHSEVLGVQCFLNLGEIPGVVDLAIIAVPAAVVPAVLEDAGRKGTRLVIVASSGFSETGDEGRKAEMQLVSICRRYGMRMMGPNTLGVLMPSRKINTTWDPVAPKPGKIAFISQSGALITTVIDWSIPVEVGFSAVFSVGNQADLGFVDYLRYVEADPETKAVILYIEEIRDGCRFIDEVAEVTETKPVIALKSGSSKKGQAAASSHTGSIAGSYETYLAAFRKSGVIAAFSIRDAFNIAELLASEGYPKGRRAFVISAAGGFAVLAADYADRYGIDLAEIPPALLEELDRILPSAWNHGNPIDIIGDAGADRYARVFDVLIRNQNAWDIAFVVAVPSAVLDPAHLGQEICRFSKATHKMIVGCLLGGDSMKAGLSCLRASGIPNYADIEDAFIAIGRTLQWMNR